MSISVTLQQLVIAWPALTIVFQSKTTDQKIIYDRKKLRKLVVEAIHHYEEQSEALVERFGTPRALTAEVRFTRAQQGRTNDKPEYAVMPSNPRAPEFFAEVRKLGAVVVTLECPPITRASLAGVPLSSDDDDALDPLLEPADAPDNADADRL